jgi:hypothetical protein
MDDLPTNPQSKYYSYPRNDDEDDTQSDFNIERSVTTIEDAHRPSSERTLNRGSWVAAGQKRKTRVLMNSEEGE